MGLCGSKSAVEDAVMARYPRTIQGLDIQGELDKWLDKFLDREDGTKGRGRMQINDFLALFDFDITPWSRRVFRLVDEDGGGSLDFREFVFSTWNYLTMDKNALLGFVYDVYSASGNQFDYAGMEVIITEVYGATKAAGKALSVLEKKLARTKGHCMRQDAFMQFCSQNSAVMYPVVNMQKAMRDYMFGPGYWNSAMKKRIKRAKANPKYQYPRWRELLRQLTRADDEAAIRAGVVAAPPPPPTAGAGAGEAKTQE